MKIDITNPIVLGTIAFAIGLLIFLLIQIYKFFTKTEVTEVTEGITEIGSEVSGEGGLEELVPPPPNPKTFKKSKITALNK